jgi:type 1 fimbria pilin
MQKIIYLALVLASCATVKSKKVIVTPVGNWDYTITGTPNGDYAGVMTISEKENIFAAVMKTNEGELVFTSVHFDKTTNTVTGNFNYQGSVLDFNATLAGEALTGTISAGGYGFPFKGIRKPEE